MRKFITKAVKSTTISSKEITIENGNVTCVPLENFSVLGDYDIDRADRVAKKHYKGKNVVVTAVEVSEKLYRMETEKFLELAEEVEEEKNDTMEESK